VGADFHSSFTPRLVSWDDFLTRGFVMMDSTDTSYRLAPAEHAFGSTLTAGRSSSDDGHDAPVEDAVETGGDRPEPAQPPRSRRRARDDRVGNSGP
jgi:hypothetical protein